MFHLSRKSAERTIFKGLIASGWHTAAMTMRLFVQTLNFAKGAIGLGVDKLRWPNAVRPGDVLTVETKILDMRLSRSRPRYGIIRSAQRDHQPARRGCANDAGQRNGAEAAARDNGDSDARTHSHSKARAQNALGLRICAAFGVGTRPRVTFAGAEIGELSESSSFTARCSNGLFEIVRQRSFEILPFAGARVTKTELPCVQHLARKIFREPAARRFCHPTRDYQDDADAPEFDVCGHCAMCIQPDSPARSNEERDIQFWPRDRGVNSRSFFADAPDVVRFCSSITPVSFRNFPATRAR